MPGLHTLKPVESLESEILWKILAFFTFAYGLLSFFWPKRITQNLWDYDCSTHP